MIRLAEKGPEHVTYRSVVAKAKYELVFVDCCARMAHAELDNVTSPQAKVGSLKESMLIIDLREDGVPHHRAGGIAVAPELQRDG